MIYSQEHNIAFVHYPKTGGTAMFDWFTNTFPDACLVLPGYHHVALKRGVELLKHQYETGQSLFTNFCTKCLSKLGYDNCGFNKISNQMRVIGVIRNPLEMLISLFEFYSKSPMSADDFPMVKTAQNRNFARFVGLAVNEQQISKYEDFFDYGGRFWNNTRLIDFNNLQAGLEEVCREIGIPSHIPLQKLNSGSGSYKNIDEYKKEMSVNYIHFRDYFKWYYTTGVNIMVSGSAKKTLLRAS